MKTKLIKLSDQHYVVVDDSEIKVDDWYVGWANNYSTEPKQRWVLYNLVSTTNGDTPRKITHSTQPELLGDGWMQSVTPLLLSEVEEAINGYSVEKLAENHIKESETSFDNWKEIAHTRVGYIEGFKAHQELTKDKLFTKEDMINSLKELSKQLFLKKEFSLSDSIEKSSKIIQSLLPKTEWPVEIDEQGKIKLI